MTVTFEKINTLSDVDFESLCDASFPDIDINFFNKVPKEMTDDQKKQYYFDQCNSAVSGLSPLQKEGESFFGFKIVVDGVDRVLNAGFLEADGTTYRGHWYLASPINGSRSFIYSAETATVRQAFFQSEGITYYKAPTFTGSLMYQALQRNNTSNVISIVDQLDNTAVPGGVVIKVQV
jgi:hypothetical protein